jgi:hypothetical protein
MQLHKRVHQAAGILFAFAFLNSSIGAPIDHATITEVVNDVKILDPQSLHGAAAHPNGIFKTPQIMQTGPESRSEMVAEDQTITRVGADTLFSFEPKERTINLRQGSILFQSPTGKGGGVIRTESATAAVLGTTIIVVATRDGGFKILVLEGTAQVTMPNGSRRIVHGGQLVVVKPGSNQLGPVLDFLLADEIESSRLVTGFNDQLPSWPKIQKTILKQNQEIALGEFQAPTVVIGNVPDPNITINNIQGSHVYQPRPTPPPPPPPVPKSTPTPPPPPTTRRNPSTGAP